MTKAGPTLRFTLTVDLPSYDAGTTLAEMLRDLAATFESDKFERNAYAIIHDPCGGEAGWYTCHCPNEDVTS